MKNQWVSAKFISSLVAIMLLLALVLPVATAQEGSEKIINIGVTDSLGTLNPLLQDGGELNKYATGLLFLPLVELNQSLEFEGQLAESITTEDNLVFTVKLYENAAWSDGTPVTADDVIFTVLRLTSKAVGNVNAGIYAGIVGFDDAGFSPDEATEIEGIAKVDEHTLTFTFKQATSLATFQNSYARYLMTVPKHVLGDIPAAELGTSPWFSNPDVVSGPFTLTAFDNNHYISYAANKAYFKGAPKVDKLNIQILTGSQLYAGLASGEIDFVQQTMGIVPQEDYESVEALKNIDTVLDEPLTNQLVFINTRTVPDARVRQAILHAIDREQLVSALLQGRGAVVDGFLTPYSPYFDDALIPVAYDPEKAKALLAEAQWDSAQKLTFMINGGDSTFVLGASIIAAQLAQVGIQVELRTVDFASLWDYVAAKDFDLYAVQYTIAPIDPSPDANWLISGDNHIGYQNQEIDGLLASTQKTSDVAELREIYGQINRIMQQDVPLFSAYAIRSLGAKSNRLLNANPRVYGFLTQVEQWDIGKE